MEVKFEALERNIWKKLMKTPAIFCIIYAEKNNLFAYAYKLYHKHRREEDMTDNGKPKYFSLMEQLRNDIVSGAIRPGEKLPSENELSQKYSLSRHTVR